MIKADTTGLPLKVNTLHRSSNHVESLFAVLKYKTPKPTAYEYMIAISRGLVVWSVKQSNGYVSIPHTNFTGKTHAYANLRQISFGEEFLRIIIKRQSPRLDPQQSKV
jgi:hypothetical protein